jgi:hypothetical protein
MTMTESNKMSDLLKSREAWGRNLVTLLLVGAIAATGIYYWGLIVPFLLEMATNTLKLAGACAALGAMLWVVLDPKMRTLALYGYRSLTRWLTRQFIDIDPIGILNTYVARLKERLSEMEEAIGSLQGQRDQLASFISKNEEERVHELQRAAQAKKIMEQGGDNAADMRGQMQLSGRQAGRLEASNKTLSALLVRMDNLLKALKKMRDTSSMLMQDIQADVKLRTEEYKMVTKGFSAFQRAQKMMASGGAEKELYDQTLDKLAEDYSEKMGQIEYFMEVSKSMINGADLDNLAYEDSALAQLEKWEKEGKNPNVRVSTDATSTVKNVRVGEEEVSPDSFSELFENKDAKR